MPLPSTLLTATHGDLDLRLTQGAWPADCRGEMFISAPVPHHELTYALFGFGAMIRLSLRPGPRRPTRSIRLADADHRLTDQAALRLAVPHAFASGPLGYTSPLGAPTW